MQLTLWRAATVERPWFGYRSFWTPSRSVAYDFGSWLAAPEQQQELQRVKPDWAGPVRVYRVEVDWLDEEVNDLRPPGAVLPLDSGKVLAAADAYAAQGYRMVLFHEGPYLGRFWPQGVYLGTEALPAVPDDSAGRIVADDRPREGRDSQEGLRRALDVWW